MDRRYAMAFIGLAAIALAGLSQSLSAHEGHGKGEIAPYDLDTPRKVSPETAAHIGLETAEVDFGAVQEVLRLIGVVRPVPDQVHKITSRIAGTILKITVQVGETVRKGDLIVQIDSPALAEYVYEARKLDSEYFQLLGELAGAESRIDELLVLVEAALEHASIVDAELARLQDNTAAVAVNVLSDKRADAVQTRSEARLRAIELSLAHRLLEAMNQQVIAMAESREALREVIASIRGQVHEDAPTRVAATDTTGLRSDRLSTETPGRLGLVSLYAPMSGVVIHRGVTAGQGVDAGEELVEIADYASVQIEGELPESLVDRLGSGTGMQVRIRNVSNTVGDPIGVGRVRFISPMIDPIKRTTHVIVSAENADGRLRDGLYVELSIVLREAASAIVVPASAVVTDGPMHFVFLQDGEFYKKQDIDPGVRDDRVVEVLDGVFPGDVVVTRGAYSLTQLRPKAPAAADAAGEGDETTSSG